MKRNQKELRKRTNNAAHAILTATDTATAAEALSALPENEREAALQAMTDKLSTGRGTLYEIPFGSVSEAQSSVEDEDNARYQGLITGFNRQSMALANFIKLRFGKVQ